MTTDIPGIYRKWDKEKKPYRHRIFDPTKATTATKRVNKERNK